MVSIFDLKLFLFRIIWGWIEGIMVKNLLLVLMSKFFLIEDWGLFLVNSFCIFVNVLKFVEE